MEKTTKIININDLFAKYISKEPVPKRIERTVKHQHCVVKFRLLSPKQQDYTSLKEIAKDLELSYSQIWRIYKKETTNHPEIKIEYI